MSHHPRYYYIPPLAASRFSCARHATPPSCADAHRPHTYGVRLAPRGSFATNTCRPTACARITAEPAPNVQCSLYIVHCWFYSFSAKERDSETGLSYFGSRYYSSDLSIWLSVDPQAAKFPYQSNYVYCGNNPLVIVDPNGEDEWDLARDGTLTKRDGGRTDIDIVYATAATGESTYKEFSAGSINSSPGSYEFTQDFYDDNGNPYTKQCTTNYMNFSDVSEAFSFFEFAAENTDVEWAISSSDNEARVGTAKEPICVSMPGVEGEKEFYHSHDLRHTGKESISTGDIEAAKIKLDNNISIGIYMAGERQYYMLDKVVYPNEVYYGYQGRKEPARSEKH